MQIDLTSIFISNAMGLVLLFLIASMNAWRFKEHTMESRILLFMLIILALACISDPFVFMCDGHDGIGNAMVVFGGNTLLFLANAFIAVFWDLFIANHLEGHVSKTRFYIMAGFLVLSVLILFVNIFYPLVFHVTDSNSYERRIGYYIFMIADLLWIADSLGVYIRVKLHGGILKFFPIWLYFIPLVLGMVFQSVFYGISVIWPATCVSYLGIILSLQNELVFRDRLTGLYNRYFLDTIKNKFRRKKNAQDSTAMMLDLNHFKAINDEYGHLEGDEALIRASVILKEAVGAEGVVIRYAGDEFIILLNTQDPDKVGLVEKNINEGFDTYNEMGVKPYKMSVSMGISNINLKDKTVDEMMNEIDRKMYENKKSYYDSLKNND